MEKRRPQLSLDDLEQLKWLLGGVLALLAIWTVLFMELDTWTLLLPATILVSATLANPRLPARLPAWVQVLSFPVIGAVFLADLWMNGDVLPAMIRLALMLIVFRCVGYRARRDDLQLLVLGLFLVVVAGVLTVSLAFALQIVAFTACGLAYLLVITLVDAAGAQYPAPRIPLFTLGLRNATPAWTQHADWRQLFSRLRQATDWRLLVIGVLSFGGLVVVSTLLFLAIPRFQLENSLFLERLMTRKARTGFTERVRFGDVTDIMADDQLALSVDVPSSGTVPAVPYLRMLVLDEYVDGGFRMSAQMRSDWFEPERNIFLLNGTERAPLRPPPNAAPSSWIFYFEAGVSRFMPIPGSFTGLQFSEQQNVSESRDLRLVALRNEPAAMVAYEVKSVNTAPTLPDPRFALRMAPNARLPIGRPDGRLLTPAEKQMGLPTLAPGDQARLEEALASLRAGEPRAVASQVAATEFARLACDWLAARHSYSMQSSIPSGGGDPLVRWLSGSTPGHCELFAGAFVVLARQAGFPARMVTGFKGGTWNAYTGNLTVRNNHAHAWCEIWDGSAGAWVRVDPTPGSAPVSTEARAETEQPRRFDSSWSARLDSLRILWYRQVVSFDQNTQFQALRKLREATKEGGLRARAGLEGMVARTKQFVEGPWNARRWAGFGAALAVVALLAWSWHNWVRGWRWNWGVTEGGSRVDPVRAEAGRWLGRMDARGWKLEATDLGPDGRSSEPMPDPAGSSGVVDRRQTIGELMRLRYASPSTWPKPDRVFRDARRVCRDAGRSAGL